MWVYPTWFKKKIEGNSEMFLMWLMWVCVLVCVCGGWSLLLQEQWIRRNYQWLFLFIFIINDSTCALFWVHLPTHIYNVGFISTKWDIINIGFANDCFMWLPTCQVAFLIITRKQCVFQTHVLDLRLICHVSRLYWTDGSPVGLQSVCSGGWLCGTDKRTKRRT